MNKIFLIGNLTHDPELRTTPSGVTLCSFSIAVNRRFQTQGNEKVTDYFRITTWRQTAENCSKYLSKGRKVAVVGELQARTYEANDGSTRMSLDVSADEVEFLTPRSEGSGDFPGGNRFAPARPANASAPMSDPNVGFTNVEDELPF